MKVTTTALMKRLVTVWRSGPSNTILFLGLTSTIVLLLINMFAPLSFERKLFEGIAILLLAVLGELLYLKLEEKAPRGLVSQLNEAGISSVLPRMKGNEVDRILSGPGDQLILNTWVFNWESVGPLLQESLRSDRTRIEIVVLDPDSVHATNRGLELNDAHLKASIEENLKHLGLFVMKLDESERQRIRICKFDSVPKFSVYACDKRGFVGFYWPGHYAVQGSQFLIEGEGGHFARLVWEYCRKLKRTEITADELKRYGTPS